MTVIQSRHIVAGFELGNKHRIAEFAGEIDAVFLVWSEAEPKQRRIPGQDDPRESGHGRRALTDGIRKKTGVSGIELPVAAVGEIQVQQLLAGSTVPTGSTPTDPASSDAPSYEDGGF